MSANAIKFVVLLGVAGGASAFVAKDRANTFEQYGLSGPTLEFAQTCDRSMRRYKLEFTAGASNHAGCACMAREVSTNIDAPDYEYLLKSFEGILKARHDKDEDAAAAIILEAVMSGDEKDAENLMTTMGYMKSCSNRTSEQEIRQSYIAENTEQSVNTAALEKIQGSASNGRGLRSNVQTHSKDSKPAGKCATLTDKQLALREENAREAGLRFDRVKCKSYSL